MVQPDAGEISRLFAVTYRYLLASVNTPGALAMVVNPENHPGRSELVAKHVSKPWPKAHFGQPRLIVPTVRSVESRGESLTLKMMALDKQPVKSVTLKTRFLGGGDWQSIPAAHVARAVWQVKVPDATHDFQYYVVAGCAGGQSVVWPAAAPEINQTVIVTWCVFMPAREGSSESAAVQHQPARQ